MKKLNIAFLLACLFIFSAFSAEYLQSWNISDDFVIKFSGTSVEGTFNKLDGGIQFDANDLSAAMMDVSVDANSISTGNSTKDKHAKGESWFDAEKYPTINFKSSSFESTAQGYKVIGALTLHGVTKTVEIPFTFNNAGTTGVFEGKFSVNTEDYGIEGTFFSFTVGDDFSIELKVPVNQ